MVVKEKIGNINFFPINNREIDYLLLEWYETSKRILHKKTNMGREVIMKFLNANPLLTEGDIIYEDDFTIIMIDIKECEVMAVRPRTMYEMASVCYETGNKHLAVYYQQDEILVPYEAPLYNLLLSAGYDISQQKRKLINPLKTSVLPHGHSSQESLFSKIMKLTNPPG